MSTDTSREPRVLTGVRWLVLVISVFVLFAMMFYTVANVVSRVAAGTPLPAVIELVTRWWMVPLVFGGWLIAHLADEHIRVEFITERATGLVASLSQLLTRLLLLLFLGIVAYGGWVGATQNRLRSEHGIDTHAPVWITRYAVPLMVGAFILFVVYGTAKLVMQMIRRSDESPAGTSDTTDGDIRVLDDPEVRGSDSGAGLEHPQDNTRTGAHHDHA